MLLIGVNRSPYPRRVAITLQVYGVRYEQQALSGFGNRAEVRARNPLGRIPALVLDNGEVLVDSGAIIDHLDEVHGRDRALTPAAGADRGAALKGAALLKGGRAKGLPAAPEPAAGAARRAVLKVAALMMGACDKGLHAAYERNHHPPEKVHQPWIDDCMAQMTTALAAVEAMADPATPYLLLGRLTQADVTAFIAERLARGLGVDTETQMPRLRALAKKLAEEPAFRSTEPTP